MTRPVTAICDKCGNITDVDFKQKHHPNKIRETYFKCEHCHYHYTSFVTDAWVRKRQRKAADIRKIPRRNGKDHLWRIAELNKLQEQINSRMSDLKYNLINFGRVDL